MNLTEKEQVLHKVVAATAFLFALSILPVAQFVLQSNYLEPSGNTGQVAGASTEKETVRGNFPAQSKAECEDTKAEELSKLEDWQRKTFKALDNLYQQKVKPYQEASQVLTGTADQIQQERQSLDGLITQERESYLKKVSDFEEAAESQKAAIESRVCPAE